IEPQLQRRERFYLRIRRYALLLLVALKLTSYNVVLFQGDNRFEHFDFFVPHRFAIGSGGRLHGQVSHDLKQMVLDHIAERTGLIVKGASALDSEVLRHGDLYAFDMIAIAKMLQNRTG